MMNLPPGPRSFRDLLRMLKARKENPIKLYEDIFRDYGDVAYFQLGSYRFVMLNDPDAIEQVLQTDAKNYTKSTGYERFKLIVGNGLLASEGELWRRQRRLMSWAFASKNIERLHQVMVQECQEMLSRWEGKSDVDLAEEMNLVTLQIISVSLFGKSQLTESSLIRESLQTMLSYLQTTKHLWIQFALWPVPLKQKRELALKIETALPFKESREFFKAIKEIDSVVHRMIEQRRSIAQPENFLDAMISATDTEDHSQMTPAQLRDEVVNMLIAGHETTANALTWTWRQLIQHPDVYQRVQDEIDSVIEGEAPTFEELPRLVYTKAVIEESMRLYPPFWRISRKNTEATTIKGYNIPAGTNIICSIYTVQRRLQNWDAPLTFNPDRFLPEYRKQKHRFAFIPFGGGPRVCIGSQFAIAEALTIMAIALKRYNFKKKFQDPPDYFVSLTLQPKDGCRVELQRKP